MFWLKACPRCKGDLFLDANARGKDIVCLQCGYRRYILTSGDGRASKDYHDTQQTPRRQMRTKHRVPVTL
jgi:uncharacterized Zn finger protein (UPF0148 family)